MILGMTDSMSGPRRYRVTVDVEAWQWDGTDGGTDAILSWISENGGSARCIVQLAFIRIDTDDSKVYDAAPGDWIIRGVTGSFFVKQPAEFSEQYMEVSAI